MINRNEYAWEDIQVMVDGKNQPFVNITAVEYTKKRKHENLYGAGSDPVGISRGNVENEGSITLRLSEILELQRNWGDITKKVFTVTVSYTPEDGGASTTDQLTHCRISELKKGMKQNDLSMEVELPLVIGKINYAI